MQVLLLNDVRKLGYIGDVVEVKPGYARNYLVPYGLATEPTEENLKAIEEAKQKAAQERALRMKAYKQLAESLEGVSVTIEVSANEEGTLYGSVGRREISAALDEAGRKIDPEFIMLSEPIRSLDNRTVGVEFTDEITAEVKVWVVREGALPEAEGDEAVAEGGDADAGEAADEPEAD